MNNNIIFEKSFSEINTLYPQVAALHTILEYWQQDPFDEETWEVEIFRIHEKRYRRIIREVMNWSYDHDGTSMDIQEVTRKLNIISERLQLLERYKEICKNLYLIPNKKDVDRMNNIELRMEINQLIEEYDNTFYDRYQSWKLYTPFWVGKVN